jgi:hypothetical protein
VTLTKNLLKKLLRAVWECFGFLNVE